MKELLYKSSYREIFYHTDKNLIEMNYFTESESCTDNEYKKETKILLNYFRQKEASLFYINMLNFDYIIIPEIQKWAAEILQPVLMKAGVTKLAIITSKQIFTKLSVKQMINKFTEVNNFFETRYFPDKKAAMKWLVE